MTPSYLTYEIQRQPRWNTFFAGLILNFLAIAVAVVVAPRLHTVGPQQEIATREHVTLIAPVLEPKPTEVIPPQEAKLEAPEPRPIAPRVTPPEPPKKDVAKVELPKIEPRAVAPKQPVAEAFAPAQAPAAPKETKPMEVKTNVFTAQASATATLQKPPRQVQTGGFGDPNGVQGQGDEKRNAVTVAKLGSFDSPQGPGRGNGTGGSRGVSGTIRAAGFSDESTATAATGNGNRQLASSGFGDVVAKGGEARSLQIPRTPDLQPIEITYKPRPAYTPEARQLRVEGEVLLDVIFGADGSLKINRVVKGLGHGLDDTALTAAQHIRFKPARRDGQPYDCAALVHMVFALTD